MTAVEEEYEQEKCPRCEENQSRNPVLSRTDGETEICAECGTDERIEALRRRVTPQRRWPVERKVRAGAPHRT